MEKDHNEEVSRVGFLFMIRKGRQSYYGNSNIIEDIVCTSWRQED